MNVKVIVLCCISLFLCRTEEVKATNFEISQRINNFTLEFLYFTKASEGATVNLIISPLAVWTTLLILAEGATTNTQREICHCIRVSRSSIRKGTIRKDYDVLRQHLEIQTLHLDVQRLNAVFVDKNIQPEINFISKASYYNTAFVPLNITDSMQISNQLDVLIPYFNYRKNLVGINDIAMGTILPYNALYFRGIWTFRFITKFTTKQAFYDNDGKKLGVVDMMYNQHTFPSTNIDSLKARAIELPYGIENRFSMIVLLPNAGVSLHAAFVSFANTSFNEVFEKLDRAKEYPEDVVVLIPKLRIKTSIDVRTSLNSMGVYSLFDSAKAMLPYIAQKPTYAKKFSHNVEIEVTETGVNTSAAMESVIGTRVGGPSYIVNRPFMYFIVEKITKTIMFCGVYQTPT